MLLENRENLYDGETQEAKAEGITEDEQALMLAEIEERDQRAQRIEEKQVTKQPTTSHYEGMESKFSSLIEDTCSSMGQKHSSISAHFKAKPVLGFKKSTSITNSVKTTSTGMIFQNAPKNRKQLYLRKAPIFAPKKSMAGGGLLKTTMAKH
jgi:hypothetical protein